MMLLAMAVGLVVLSYFVALGIKAYMDGNTFSKSAKRGKR